MYRSRNRQLQCRIIILKGWDLMQYLHSVYIPAVYKRDDSGRNNESEPDRLVIFYRDDNNTKHYKVIEHPRYTFYVAKQKLTYHHNYYPIKNTIPVTCKYKDLDLTIAKTLGLEKEYYELAATRSQARKILHYNHNVFGSDMDIEDFYKRLMINKYDIDNHDVSVTKAYFDIEVDTYDYDGLFPDEEIAPCPVNAISLYLSEYNTMYSFLLDNGKINRFDTTEFIKYLKTRYDNDIEFKIYFFTKELDLILAFFKTIHHTKPDFCLAWHLKFDILTLINRLKHHGIEPKSVMCHPDFDQSLWFLYFRIDNYNIHNDSKFEYLKLTSYTQYLDQMLIYANLRKGIDSRESDSLNYIAKRELKDSKLDYSEQGSLSLLPYTDYKRFVEYNIKDTWLLHRIEEKTKDLDQLIGLSNLFRTRVTHALRNSVALKNLAYEYYYRQGYVMGNNINRMGRRSSATTESRLRGAVMSDPLLNQHKGTRIYGSRSNLVFDYTIDFDLSSQYPSIIRAFNIEASTQLGLLMLGDSDTSGELFTESYFTQNPALFMNQWFGLPSSTELLERFDKYKELQKGR